MRDDFHHITIDPPTAAAPEPSRGGPPLLTLRLSDGSTWSHEFDARTHHDLREGCMEAWVQCVAEWQRRAELLPAHQSIKRAKVLASIPYGLQLHVLDTPGKLGHWIDANHAVDPTRRLTIYRPDVPARVDGSDWLDCWSRCLKTWIAADAMARFLNATLPRFLRDELDEV